ncbi:MAG: hypothetical protein K0S33_3438 [Bacteroidetes bacterium]|jgi:hypothetical protein|nr:hypothetical protein [Bacteroidota bacterium]
MSTKEENIQIDLGHSLFFMREDGIVQVNGRDHTYSVNELKEGIECMRSFCSARPYPFLFIAQKNSMFDSAALSYFSTRGALSFSGARAYVLHSRIQRMLAAIFVSDRNNDSPAKAFRTKGEAIEWLNTQITRF